MKISSNKNYIIKNKKIIYDNDFNLKIMNTVFEIKQVDGNYLLNLLNSYYANIYCYKITITNTIITIEYIEPVNNQIIRQYLKYKEIKEEKV